MFCCKFFILFLFLDAVVFGGEEEKFHIRSKFFEKKIKKTKHFKLNFAVLKKD